MEILTQLAVMKVYFGIAGMILALFAVTFLGGLSRQLVKAQKDTLDVDRQA